MANPDIPKRKDEILALLARNNVAKAEVIYNGSGDEGCIDECCYYDAENKEVTLPKEDADSVEEYIFACLEENRPGWEINEGSNGTAHINVAKGTVEFSHMVMTETDDDFEV